jgi:hypothetical protein
VSFTPRARRLQHRGAELLRAEPSGAARMRDRDGVGRQIREVPADQARVGDDVRAVEREVEAAFGRGRVGARSRVVKSRRAGAARLGGLRHRAEEIDLGCVGGGEHIAAPIEVDAVAGRARDSLDQIDAAVHEGGHRPVRAGPPVAVGFGRLVGGERERVARLDDGHVFGAVLGKRIGRRYAGDAGAADDDLCGIGHHDLTPYPAFMPFMYVEGSTLFTDCARLASQ